MIAQVVASERARAQTDTVKAVSGLEDHNIDYTINLNCVGKQAIEGESPVLVSLCNCSGILSRGGLEKSPLNLPALSGKAKYYQ